MLDRVWLNKILLTTIILIFTGFVNWSDMPVANDLKQYVVFALTTDYEYTLVLESQEWLMDNINNLQLPDINELLQNHWQRFTSRKPFKTPVEVAVHFSYFLNTSHAYSTIHTGKGVP